MSYNPTASFHFTVYISILADIRVKRVRVVTIVTLRFCICAIPMKTMLFFSWADLYDQPKQTNKYLKLKLKCFYFRFITWKVVSNLLLKM